MSPSGRSQSLALSNLITDDGYDEVAITYVNNDYGQSLNDAFVDAYDGEIAYNSPHDQEQQSYSGPSRDERLGRRRVAVHHLSFPEERIPPFTAE